MLNLRTLGGLDLRDAADRKVSTVLAHPKRTALLAYLALAAPRGPQRRDSLLAVFWPESNQDLARASLRKALHHLRKSLGEDAVVSQDDDQVGISAQHVWCDAVELDRAVDGGDAERVQELYKGPLLEGFFLPDAPEFERWLERERSRLRDRAFQSAWKSAEVHEAAGAAYEAAMWARKAVALVPDDESALRKLLQLLDRVGDRGGALSAYDDFTRRLARDFDVEPAAETQAVIARIKAAAPKPASPKPAAPSPGAQGPAAVPRAAPAASESPAPAPELQIGNGQWRSLEKPVRLAAVAALVAVVGWQTWRYYEASASPPAPIATAVLPFSFRGSPELAYLAGGMPALLGTSLDGVGMQTADSARARYHVAGEIIEAGGRLRVSAEMRDAEEKRVVARASAEDSSTRIFALVDRLAAQLVASGAKERSERLTQLASVTTTSIPALRAYLDGDAKFRVGHFKEAVDAYQRAVMLDSTFALAFYRLAVAYCWSSDTLCRPAARRASSLSHRLSENDRMLIQAYVSYAHGDADDAERRYREIVRLRPFDGEAWYQLGEVMFHFNGLRGRPTAESRSAFQRALANGGPKDATLTHLLEVEAIDREYATYDSLVVGINAGSHFDLVGRTVSAFTKGGEEDRARIIAETRRAPDAELLNYARHAMFLLVDRESVARVVRLLLDPSRPSEVRAQGHILLAHLEASAGRLRAVDAELRAAEALDRTRALEHRALIESAPFLAVPAHKRLATLEALSSWSEDAAASGVVFGEDRTLHPSFRRYLIGLLSAETAQFDRAHRIADELEREGTGKDRLLVVFGRGVRARAFALQQRGAEALGELAKESTGPRVSDLLGLVPAFGQDHERFLRAELLRDAGRLEEALGWYSSFGQHSASDRLYLAPAHKRMAGLLTRMGRRAEAAEHYRKFIALWKDCDPELRPMLEQARAQLADVER